MINTNPMPTQEIIIILVIGLMAGILSGLVGIGGGIILVPALVYFLSYTQHQAQGTSLGVLTFPGSNTRISHLLPGMQKNGCAA